jgi:transposase InsO family protein
MMSDSNRKPRTRSATKTVMKEAEVRADSGINTPSCPGLQSTPPQQLVEAPTVGGLSDHGEQRLPLEMTTPVSECTVKARSNASHTSRLSQAGREALRMRAEYEAELEVAKLKESLIKKKLALQMAELAAQEEEEDDAPASVASGASARVARWLSDAPGALGAPVPDLPHVALEPPPLPKSQALSDMDRLAEAIGKLGQARGVPRQMHEIPIYDGNAADWLSFEKAYRSTTEVYNFKPFENMARLRVALVGEAKAAVADLLRTSSDPEEVLRALEDEFGHPNRLLECAIKKVRDLPTVTENGPEIRNFTTTVRNCVSVLKSIRADGYLNNPQLVSELLGKLTPYQRAQYGEFALRLDNNSGVDLRVSPNLNMLVDFLSQLSRASSYYTPISLSAECAPSSGAIRRDKDKYVVPVRAGGQRHRVHTQVETVAAVTKTDISTKNVCAKCKASHKLNECSQFKSLTIDERWDLIKQNRLCFKCILKTHSSRFCRAKRCSKCNWSHHELLHKETQSASPPAPAVGPPPNVPPPATTTPASAPVKYETVTNIGGCRARALLKVIPVTLVTNSGVERPSYALLDDGASVSILDDKLASDVDGPVEPLKLRTAGGHCVTDNTSRSVKIVVRGPNGVCHDISVRTLHNFDLPSQALPARVLEDNVHLRDLNCSEMREAKPMLLLGQDNWELIVGREIRQGKSGRPVASLTRLGWVVHGPLGGVVGSDVDSANCISTSLDDLHALVKGQFELEAIGISHVLRKNSNSERALEILDKTCRRVSDNSQQWEVGLLWARENVEMPDNYDYAFRRLTGIERKMDRDPSFADAYTKQVDRLLAAGYAREVDGIQASPVWYLPHFGVFNPNKPGKLRLVYDAAAAYQGVSLNSNLLSGPDLMNSLLGALIKFRSGCIAFTADIADMFMRVKIREADQGAQLFLWRGPDRDKDPSIYVMNSMIFGAASSPTSAIYVLNKNAKEFKDTHPAAVEAIKTKHYVDDYLDSVDSVHTAEQLIADVTHIHRAGGFDIRGWVTNSPELGEKLPAVVPGRVKLDKSESERTLGMIWCPSSDCMQFDLSFKRLPIEIVDGQIKPTKREFLRFIMSIFDPLGLVYPCIIQSRVLMQRVWQSGIDWDECIKDSEAATWFQWLNKLKTLSSVAVPRWYGLQRTANVDLHVFGDASEKAYAAVAFLVGTGSDGNSVCTMVAGKARVAPVKVVSIPRLELQAAVLACRLAVTIKSEVNFAITNLYLWTDSKTVLMWIKSDARDYQKYVSHRLAEIDNLSKRSNWHWVPSESNPADEATRMDWPNNKNMWLSGPPFLCNPQVPWPSWSREESPTDDPERLERALVAAEDDQPLIDVTRYSTWTKAVHVTARVLTFISACRASPKTGVSELTAEKLQEAERLLLRQSQARSFPDELSALQAGRSLPKSSRLIKLDPMLYDDELLRVRGRLGASTELSFDERHPVILDGSCHITRLLVQHYHTRALHANHETVVNNVRERFWVTSIRPTVKAVVARCQYCRVQRARPNPPKMGDLPLVRLTTTRRAFVNCGIDYFGPMQITIGRRREKRWGVLFTCLATRAVHLELAASLSSDSAILALRRLIARRGQPATILSDCGTNFVGANKELRAALRGLNARRLQGEALTKGIDWRFNPPAAPHMGGVWERLVRSVKNALNATLRERAPSEEVLHTVLLEAELVVNSRPLSYVASDPDEPVVLTPNHLLLGTAAGDTRSTTYDPSDVDARRQWKKANGLAEMFWRRWTREYLPTLQRRQKWATATDSVKVGDVVVFCDGKQPRNMWPRGIISKVFPGSDGHVRVVDIRTPTGSLRRPVARIAVLPTDGTFIG